MSWARFTRVIHCAALVPCLLARALAGCQSADADPPPVRASVQWLVGGATDTSDPAVVLTEMILGNSGGMCTASFIDRSVLLTAAHCVADDNGRSVPAAAKYRFYRGADLSAAAERDWVVVQTKNVHAHPEYDPNTSANDVAVLVLDQPVDVVPLAINTKGLAQDMIGAEVRLVGYGSTSGTQGASDGFGRKRMLTTSVQMVQSDVLLIGNTGHQACDGDSGGPALLTIAGVETIIGTDDYNAFGLNCTRGDYYQRVDRQLDFISSFLPPGGGATVPSNALPQSPVAGAGAADAGVPTSSDSGVPPPGDTGRVAPTGVTVQTTGGTMAIAMGGSAGATPLEYDSSGCNVALRRSGSHAGMAATSVSLLAFALLHRRRRYAMPSARAPRVPGSA